MIKGGGRRSQNTRRPHNAGLKFGQRGWWRTSIKPALCLCLVFAVREGTCSVSPHNPQIRGIDPVLF